VTPTPTPRPIVIPPAQVLDREDCRACNLDIFPTRTVGPLPTATPAYQLEREECLACNVAIWPTPTPTPRLVVRSGDLPCLHCELTGVPDELRPGPHTLTFEPVATRPVLTRRPEVPPACQVTLQAARPSTVGFQNSFFSGCTWHEYRQIAFKFDFSTLRGHSLLPIDAALRYHETLYHERAPNAGRVSHPGVLQVSCSLRLGRPTVDWGARSGAIPYDDARNQNGIGLFNQFLEWVPPMIHNPDYEAQGLILVGPNEDLNDDNAACLSEVRGISLSFTYAIPVVP
jgi:hypothetical protein